MPCSETTFLDRWRYSTGGQVMTSVHKNKDTFFSALLSGRVSMVALVALLLLFLFSFHNSSIGLQDTRAPAWSGSFYPDNAGELAGLMTDLTRQAMHDRPDIPSGTRLQALILPHAGYIYSGLTAAHASLVLKKGQFSKVILIGPDHRIGFENAAITSFAAYRTPLGTIPIDSDSEVLGRCGDLFRPVSRSESLEHSLEVILPFLQYSLQDFSLVPVVAGPCDIHRAAMCIDSIRDSGTLLVVSSDLSHYLDYATAVK
ncbi:MAG TPA: AmmeMemoRadiSam system protein B [Thermodesulfobacteriaceae bacterium]|nr:AmmeMemoRadiSam system protein B [Thermodesulfobacteriaceae bacterium]